MCTCNPHERFEYETTNPNELNSRDASLWLAGVTWGMQTIYSKLFAVQDELAQKTRENAFLEMILAKFRGNTPKGWSRNAGN
jgi:hypothetical protein